MSKDIDWNEEVETFDADSANVESRTLWLKIARACADPAFPRLGEGFGNPKYEETGMTLRDYFAGQALAGMAVQDVPHKLCAEMAYLTADAMLAERETTND